jgi:hypothetical protein
MAKPIAKPAAPKQPEPEPQIEDQVEEQVEEQAEAGMDVEGNDGEGLTVDLSNTEEQGGFTALPAGTYDCVVEQLDFGYSKSSQNPMWTWVFSIEEGDFANRKIFYHTTFNEGGVGRVKRALARVQHEDNQEAITQLLTTPFNPATVANDGILLGARCRVKLSIRVRDNEKQNNVQDILAPAASGGFADS